MNTRKKQLGFIIHSGRGGPAPTDKEVFMMLKGLAIIIVIMVLSIFIAVQFRETHLWLSLIIGPSGVLVGIALGFWYILRNS